MAVACPYSKPAVGPMSSPPGVISVSTQGAAATVVFSAVVYPDDIGFLQTFDILLKGPEFICPPMQ